MTENSRLSVSMRALGEEQRACSAQQVRVSVLRVSVRPEAQGLGRILPASSFQQRGDHGHVQERAYPIGLLRGLNEVTRGRAYARPAAPPARPQRLLAAEGFSPEQGRFLLPPVLCLRGSLGRWSPPGSDGYGHLLGITHRPV